MGKVTIKDIALRAVASRTSVSFAFNDPSRFSETTLRRILGVAEELGYVPDPVAPSMKTKRTGCVGLLVPQPVPEVMRNPFVSGFLECLAEVTDDLPATGPSQQEQPLGVRTAITPQFSYKTPF